MTDWRKNILRAARDMPSGSVDIVTSAQAFHWFDVGRFRSECKRILKKDGTAVLIWNMRDMDQPLNRELYDLLSRYCPEFHGFNGGIIKDDKRIKDFFADGYTYEAFDNYLFMDKDKFISRSLSGSYTLKEGDHMYGAYLQALAALFDKYAQDGAVKVANSSVAYIGKVG